MVKAIDSVARAMQVLDQLQKASPLTLSELQRCTGINKATLLRILKTLSLSGWVIKSLSENKYSLSASVLEDSKPKSLEARLAEAAAPILDELYDILAWPSDIAICDGDRMKLIETTCHRAESFPYRSSIRSRPEFLYSGVGRCFLALCDAKERQDIINRLKKLPNKEGKLAHDTVWLNQMIEQTRSLGYGVRQSSYYNHRTTSGLSIDAIAVPIKEPGGKLIGCLSVAWPQGSFIQASLEKAVLPHLRRAAVDIAKRMPS
ncbi:IclR family transcriptional regulator domain-containing protein [Marinomonas transparens]|uniref:Helix-turn-helix domain-containing protein n=1 Tax=Marinomonas transparens TaxID=2795388 RepID=A0A934JSH6_9GAMM|nr:IclR family transcriptional regulator C-terminal domain-containing protein [Marinomonas transparens]MBJ7537486.1 helix-turn-helix domain-containing protein [Marinomonas transparens]